LRHAFAFDPRHCMAPLPRAFQRLRASAYPKHAERLRQAHDATVPDSLPVEPWLVQGGSDDFLGPCDDALFASDDWGIDFGGEVAVITGDVPLGAAPEAALDSIRLLMLANGWRLCQPIPTELAHGFSWVQNQPATAFSPVAVTLDEVGAAWKGGRLHLALESRCNGQRVGLCEAGPEMNFHFGQLIAHVAKTRRLRAGSIVGSGTVSNSDNSHGCACMAEKRAVEALEHGAPTTAFLRFGDRIEIEMRDGRGMNIFGTIDQRVASPWQG
jgi:fumarylacetoacetate (FAA) hydrolase